MELYCFHLINVLIILFDTVNSATLCDEISDIPKGRFSTKTGYFHASKDESNWMQFRKETETCSPIKVWFFTRHGTRFPVNSDEVVFNKLPNLSEEIIFNHFQGRGCLTEEDVFEYKRWVFPFEDRDRGELHPTGAEELFNLGQQWKKNFPQIFDEPFDSSNIKVEFTDRNRTGQSAYHFLRGMYGEDAIAKIALPKPVDPNFILRFYRACPRWMRDVYRNNETTYKERNLFRETEYFQRVIRDVSQRLGFERHLSIEELLAMYNECRFEIAWFLDRVGIWCKPFTPQDIEVLEFDNDLKYYYEDSYGTPMNKEMACLTVSDLYTHLKSNVASATASPKGVLYFSHDKAILKLEALLGLFRPDRPLTHESFRRRGRNFRTSVASSFAANLGFVLFRCDSSYRVSMFFDGNPQPVSSVCPSVTCDWKDYEAFLSPIARECDFEKLCRLHDEL